MMTRKFRFPYCWLIFAAAMVFVAAATSAYAQMGMASTVPSTPAKAVPAQGTPAKAPVETKKFEKVELRVAPFAPPAAPDRAKAYYHVGLASIDEEEAITEDRPEEMTRAIEEYKLALDADPLSPELNNGLADLYFGTGQVQEAESTARGLLKSAPDNLDAHRMLGRIYLRQLSQGQGSGSLPESGASTLDEAVGEYAKIVALDPDSVDDRVVLGQLYTVKHDAQQAEAEFLAALVIEPDSEDAVLSLARLYGAKGDFAAAAKEIETVPVDDRTAKMENALGAAYEQLKRPADAIAAYRRAVDLDPEAPETLDALGRVLLSDNQLDAALDEYKKLLAVDPDNAGTLVHIGEIERRQCKYADALATIQSAQKIDPENLEAGYNAGLLLDVLGRFDEAVAMDQKMVDLTSHANGTYTDEEKSNRGFFLERLGSVYQEQNKIPQAVAAFQKMIDMGGDSAERGYQFEVDAYRGAEEYDQAVETARQAAAAFPKNLDLQLMLAGELGDVGKSDDGLAMARALLTNKSDDRTVWLTMAQIDIRVHRWKDAEDALDKADPLTTKQDDRINLLFLRGELAERQKHDGPAERCFRQVLELDPDNALTLNYLGYMFADKGVRLPEALAMIRKAVQAEPMNGAYLDSLGWAYFKMGAYDLAEQNLSQAIARDQTDPTVHDHMGELYAKTGRIRQAAAMWELSLAEYAKTAAADVDPADVAKVRKRLDGVRVRLAKEDSLLGLPKP